MPPLLGHAALQPQVQVGRHQDGAAPAPRDQGPLAGDGLDGAFGMLSLDWRVNVVEDQSLLNRSRPTAALCGDSTRLREATGWRPEFTFQALVRDMVETELARTSHHNRVPASLGAALGQQNRGRTNLSTPTPAEQSVNRSGRGQIHPSPVLL